MNQISNKDTEIGAALYQRFGDTDIGLSEIFQHIIENKLYNEAEIYKLNQFLAPHGIRVPRQGLIIERPPEFTLSEVLTHLKTCAHTHSAYCYLAMQLAGFSSFLGIKASEVNDVLGDKVVPPWLRIIMDRQRRLCLNANRSLDKSLLFAFQNGRQSQAALLDSVAQTSHRIYKEYGYNIETYIEKRLSFPGSAALLYGLRKTWRYYELRKAYDNYMDSDVLVNDSWNGRVIEKLSPGIYVVRLQDGTELAVPVYQLKIQNFQE